MESTVNPLIAARAELQRLLAEEQMIQYKIDVVRQSIKLLEPLYGGTTSKGIPIGELMRPDMGLTDRVRRVLETNPGQPLAPTRIRDLLASGGFEMAGSNPMATVHTTLKRIVDGNPQFVAVKDGRGATLYKFDPGISDSAGVPKKKN